VILCCAWHSHTIKVKEATAAEQRPDLVGRQRAPVRSLAHQEIPLHAIDLAKTFGHRDDQHRPPVDLDSLRRRQLELGGTQLGRRVEVIGGELDVRHTLDDVDLAPIALSLGYADDEGAPSALAKAASDVASEPGRSSAGLNSRNWPSSSSSTSRRTSRASISCLPPCLEAVYPREPARRDQDADRDDVDSSQQRGAGDEHERLNNACMPWQRSAGLYEARAREDQCPVG
jgi:hypothetical protein